MKHKSTQPGKLHDRRTGRAPTAQGEYKATIGQDNMDRYPVDTSESVSAEEMSKFLSEIGVITQGESK